MEAACFDAFQSGTHVRIKDIVRHADLGEGKVIGLPEKGVDPEAFNYSKAWVHFAVTGQRLWVPWATLDVITAPSAAKRLAGSHPRSRAARPPRALPSALNAGRGPQPAPEPSRPPLAPSRAPLARHPQPSTADVWLRCRGRAPHRPAEVVGDVARRAGDAAHGHARRAAGDGLDRAGPQGSRVQLMSLSN